MTMTDTSDRLADATRVADLGARLKVGDLVFIQVKPKPFAQVSVATGSWTNHVGIVIDANAEEPLIAESTFPFSRQTALTRFVNRSRSGRVAVARLRVSLDPEQEARVQGAARRRFGVFYDTGFNLHSPRQFCSRFAREVLAESTGTQIGEVETFSHLLLRRPETDLVFWKWWYFGRIPWERQTVSPASLLASPSLQIVFDGQAAA
jgi:Permuted papain-like amidase enzyme, YaeF/YiiX, C92 family